MHPLNTLPVPVPRSLPARVKGQPDRDHRAPKQDAYALSSGATRLNTSAEVERYLPDILGRALARCWIDAGFRARFCSDPRGTLAEHRIDLPDMISIEVVTQGHARPMVVVSEKDPARGKSRRLLYLQLVMVAGK